MIKITDGFDNVTAIDYASLTDADVSLPVMVSAQYPVVDIRPDLTVVKRSQVQSLKNDYCYGGLKVHVQGLGMIGFERTQSTESFYGKSTESIIEEWNPKYYAPQKIMTKSTVGSWASSSRSTISFLCGDVRTNKR